MTHTLLRAGALSCALLASTTLTAPAMAQTPQQHRALDANGVDLTHGDFVVAIPEGSIGSGDAALSLVRSGVWNTTANSNGHQWDGVWFQQLPVAGGGTRWFVNIGPRTERFDATGTLPTGSNLSGSGNAFDYRTSDGTVIAFTDPAGSWQPSSDFCNGSQAQCKLLPGAITSPDGKTVSLEWDVWTYCFGDANEDLETDCYYDARIANVSNSFGYSIQFAYASSGSGGGSTPAPSSWHQRTGATFHNAAVGGNPAQGSTGYSYPSAGVTQVTDMGGRVWRFTGSYWGISAIRRPGASSDNITIAGTPAAVTSVTRDGVTTNYSRGVSGSTATMTVTDALSQATTIVSDLTIGRVTSVTDPLSRVTAYQYDGDARLTRVTAPEGNYLQYTYDARGNVTETRAVAKSGSGLADIVTSATYDTSCADPETCNRMNSSTDARGNVTDYTYDATHGGVLTVTAPAAAGGGVRPQTRYAYSLVNGEYRVTGIAACPTQAGASGGSPAACAGAADEVVATIAYDASGNVTAHTAGDGSGALSAARAMTYDPLGNLLTVDGPLSGNADTVRYRYNAARQIVGVVGPDPDGGGARKHRAMRTSYTDGLPTSVEQGTVDSQSDGDWAAFAPSQRVEQDYDADARPVAQRLMSGSTAYALSQTSYDALGRVQCAARRMNPAEFASPPSDACTLDTQGSHGPDRIARTTYDAAGQVTKVETGYGVGGVAADEVAATWRANGQVETVTDANGNRTTYVYDGHDRPSRTRMPDPATPGTSSTTDYEELTYETVAGGTLSSPLVVSRRLRDTRSIGYSYDALGRLSVKNLPAGEADVTYGYDLLGRVTQAIDTNTVLAQFGYDALGRVVSEGDAYNGTLAYQYDLAGRRTRLAWADGNYVDYVYDVTGAMTEVRENGVTSGAGLLAVYAYDDLGRRTLLTRGNGTSTGYTYDNVSRLSGLTQDLNGSGDDVTFGYGYNPASEIASNTRSNDAYSFTLANANVASTANGLNQLTTQGADNVTYDTRGNVDAVGATGYGYYAENRMSVATQVPGGYLYYDPAGRLSFVYDPGDGSGTTARQYAGHELVQERTISGAIRRRYVFGAGTDEPLVWYEGTGLTTRRWLHADERGSVVAASDGSGNLVGSINRYDDYGSPQGGAITGRFGYTGQAWLPELAMYDYRARFYNPALGGRFMQSDPIGYGGGMNPYAYVGNNPVNFSDPSGLGWRCSPAVVFDNGGSEGSRCTWEKDFTDVRESTNSDLFEWNRGLFEGGSESDAQLILAAARRYFGLSYCSNPTIGDANRFNPQGRINSGTIGNATTARDSVLAIASYNGIPPFGYIPTNQAYEALASPVPIGVGNGWMMHTNPVSGFTILGQRGLNLRINRYDGRVAVDIPAGFTLPQGGILLVNETCHYRYR